MCVCVCLCARAYVRACLHVSIHNMHSREFNIFKGIIRLFPGVFSSSSSLWHNSSISRRKMELIWLEREWIIGILRIIKTSEANTLFFSRGFYISGDLIYFVCPYLFERNILKGTSSFFSLVIILSLCDAKAASVSIAFVRWLSA